MAAALRALAALPAARKVAVLGTMAELGDSAEEGHATIAELASELGIEVVAVDEARYGPSVKPVKTPAEAIEALAAAGATGPDAAVLVKASRAARLERVVTLMMRR